LEQILEVCGIFRALRIWDGFPIGLFAENAPINTIQSMENVLGMDCSGSIKDLQNTVG